MSFGQNEFLEKAKKYLGFGFSAGRSSPQYVFWASLALEHVARGLVSSRNPLLLLKLGNEGERKKALFLLGVSKVEKPDKSISAHEIYNLCSILVDDWSGVDETLCKKLKDSRNKELHSAENAFEELSNTDWEFSYYRALNKLLVCQGQTLSSVLDEDGVEYAEEAIEKGDEKNKEQAESLIKAAKKSFEALNPALQEERKAMFKVKRGWMRRGMIARVQCPACEGNADLYGEKKFLRAVAEQDSIVKTLLHFPKMLKCGCCGLKLESAALVAGAGLGKVFEDEVWENPGEFYEDEFDNYYMDRLMDEAAENDGLW